MTAEARLEQMVQLTDTLTERLAVESQHFEASKPLEAAKTLGETSRLANLYRHESQRLREAPQLLQAASPAVRLKLIKATEAFDAVLARHGRAISAAKVVTEGLVRVIAEEMASARPTGSGYGPGAKSGPVNARSLTLNRSA
jgi:hypothetical protein